MKLGPITMEWLDLVVRWLHVTTSMVWIGTSFYFTATDMKLRPGEDLPQGVQGEAWQIHGGNFWHMVKYTVAPKKMPSVFTWYHWDSRMTWISGAALLVLVYYLHADIFLINKSVMDLTPLQSGLFSLISLVV
ncbi:MAG: urate hydroxylase PuuD, partial [Ktedonobacteraceae bacterium]